MEGRGGQDTFVWRTTAETGVAAEDADVVLDFNPGQLEFLIVSPIDADETVAGDQEFTVIGIADFTGPGQIRSFTTATDTYILLNTDNDLTQEATSNSPACTRPSPAGSCCDPVSCTTAAPPASRVGRICASFVSAAGQLLLSCLVQHALVMVEFFDVAIVMVARRICSRVGRRQRVGLANYGLHGPKGGK
jgi:hypothetical protein